MQEKDTAFAEIIESSLHTWLAQSWKWNSSPDYGSLVTTKQDDILYLGLVHEIATKSTDPTRYPIAYQKTEQELLQEQPQIFEFLRTAFSCLILGYYRKGKMYYSTPPHPAHIHAFIYPVTPEISERFFAHNQYIHRLFELSCHSANIDELLLALYAQNTQNKALSHTALITIIETYCTLIGSDYRRIRTFLQRLEHVLHHEP